MKIIQINAWLGRLNGPLARFVSTEQPDIICMQEAFSHYSDSIGAFADQYNFVDEVKSAGGFEYEFFAPCWGFELGRDAIDEGNLILSKFPISNKQSFHTYQQYHIRRGPENVLPNTRLWQACTVQLPDGKCLSIANYQGYLDGGHGIGTEMTMQTMQKVRDKVAALSHPLIFCGDFNIWPASPALAVLDNLDLRNLTVENNVPTTLSSAHRAPLPDRDIAACDYILVSRDITVKSFEVSETVVSDHKALILEFEL